MPGLMKKLYSPVILDLLFAVAGAFSVYALYALAKTPIPPIETSTSPALKVAVLVAVVLASGLLAIFTTRLDQLCADDFMFHTLSKSAMMGQIGFFATAGIWYGALVRRFGAISSFSMVMLAVACWSLAYFIVRARGTGA